MFGANAGAVPGTGESVARETGQAVVRCASRASQTYRVAWSASGREQIEPPDAATAVADGAARAGLAGRVAGHTTARVQVEFTLAEDAVRIHAGQAVGRTGHAGQVLESHQAQVAGGGGAAVLTVVLGTGSAGVRINIKTQFANPARARTEANHAVGETCHAPARTNDKRKGAG
jgi:hypothetical protein